MRGWAALALLAAGCGQFDTGTQAERSLAEELGCPERLVEVEQLGAYRYRGEGCGRTAVVACTAGRLEPECLREGPSTAGGAWAPDDAPVRAEGREDAAGDDGAGDHRAGDEGRGAGDHRVVAEGGGGPDAPGDAPGGSEASDEPGDTPAGEGAPALPETPDPEVEARIRAGLDARRGDILACTGAERVAVRAGYAPDGSVALSLQGALSGTPEERCVQDALDGVRVPATGGAGVVVHLIR